MGSDRRLLRSRLCFSLLRKGAAKGGNKTLDFCHLRSPRLTREFAVRYSVDNIDEEYNWLVEYLHGRVRKADSLQDAERRLFLKTLELIRQRGMALAAGKNQLTSEHAKLCREAREEGLKEGRAAVMEEAAEARKKIRKARKFAIYKTRITSLRGRDETVTAARRVKEKVIYGLYSDLFESHVYLSAYHLRLDGYVVPSSLLSEIRHTT
ncbi:hypothetical protein V3C99_011795 [Haemonchus contortus]|uniref:Flagellar FliJ protein n=1 Tax=Haemonchus contortus TaxID=6289 RepID=A0A7I4Y5Q0_HAECO